MKPSYEPLLVSAELIVRLDALIVIPQRRPLLCPGHGCLSADPRAHSFSGNRIRPLPEMKADSLKPFRAFPDGRQPVAELANVLGRFLATDGNRIELIDAATWSRSRSKSAPAANHETGLVGRPIDDRDIPRAELALCQLRGRGLPVAAAALAE